MYAQKWLGLYVYIDNITKMILILLDYGISIANLLELVYPWTKPFVSARYLAMQAGRKCGLAG